MLSYEIISTKSGKNRSQCLQRNQLFFYLGLIYFLIVSLTKEDFAKNFKTFYKGIFQGPLRRGL